MRLLARLEMRLVVLRGLTSRHANPPRVGRCAAEGGIVLFRVGPPVPPITAPSHPSLSPHLHMVGSRAGAGGNV